MCQEYHLALNIFGSLVWYTDGVIRRSRPPNLMMSTGEDSKNNEDFVELPAMSQQEFEKAKRDLNEQPNFCIHLTDNHLCREAFDTSTSRH